MQPSKPLGSVSRMLAARQGRGRRQRIGESAGAVGRGLLAGVLGTAAMTASSAIEMKARKRPASSAPAQAAERALGVQPTSEQARKRFSLAVHWGYGTGWGAVRGLIGAAEVGEPQATGLHLLLVWTAGLVMLPALDVAPPPWRWGPGEVAIDMLHHGVYATVTSLAYASLDSP